MNCLVTGAAGFIGSHLCDRLVELRHRVVGVDAFIPYYAPAIKERNLADVRGRPNFHFHKLDLRFDQLEEIVAEAEIIFHLAAMPGLVRSWSDFEGYWTCNVLATKRLLEALQATRGTLRRLVCASTSSVYGRYASGDESLPTRPVSPYGVTKLAGEHLCRAYSENFGLPIVTLRYFSVYGPRQRPDMGYHKFVRALRCGEPIIVTGDGLQVRSNTYVADCVEATIAAVEALPGEIYNVGGGESANVWEIIEKLEKITERRAQIKQEAARPGDQRHTFADTTKLRSHLGWEPHTTLDQGLAAQVAWQERELNQHDHAFATVSSAPSKRTL
jgi:nucleoside-diphosphate-sugar epimerase